MGSIRTKRRTRSFEIDIEVQEETPKGLRTIIYVKSPDEDAPFRAMVTIKSDTDLKKLARQLRTIMNRLPSWDRDTNVSAVLTFIRQNPSRITSP